MLLLQRGPRSAKKVTLLKTDESAVFNVVNGSCDTSVIKCHQVSSSVIKCHQVFKSRWHGAEWTCYVTYLKYHALE